MEPAKVTPAQPNHSAVRAYLPGFSRFHENCAGGGWTERNLLMATESNSLVIFTRASQMLAEANTIQKAKELKSLALTAADWARRKGMGEEAVQHARSYALEAERKMGEMLKEKPRKPGPGRGKKTSEPDTLVSDPVPSLADLGITGHESKAAQFLADLPRPVFDAVKAGDKTLAETKREDRKAKQVAKERDAAKTVPAGNAWTLTADQAISPAPP